MLSQRYKKSMRSFAYWCLDKILDSQKTRLFQETKHGQEMVCFSLLLTSLYDHLIPCVMVGGKLELDDELFPEASDAYVNTL